MTQRTIVISKLKKALALKDMTYSDLAKKLKMSEAGVKKIFAKSNLSLERLEDICDALNIGLQDLFTTEHSAEIARRLSREQEASLAQDEKLFVVFQCLLKGFSAKKLTETFRFSPAEVYKMLSTLDKLGIIDLLPNNAVRLRVAKQVLWTAGGPLFKRYKDLVLSQFITGNFEGDHEYIDLLPLQVPAASLQLVIAKIKKLVREIRDLTELHESSVDEKTTWIVIGMREVYFSLFQKYASKKVLRNS